MKKTILVLLVAVLGTTAMSAQFTQGSKTLSGKATGFDFAYNSSDGLKALAVDLSVAGSYFVIDNLAVTAELGVASANLKYDKSEGKTSTAFGFGIGAKYYFLGGLYGGIGLQGIKAQDVDLASYGVVEVGYDYYITDNVFFEPAVYFKKGFSKKVDESNEFGLAISIGVNF